MLCSGEWPWIKQVGGFGRCEKQKKPSSNPHDGRLLWRICIIWLQYAPQVLQRTKLQTRPLHLFNKSLVVWHTRPIFFRFVRITDKDDKKAGLHLHTFSGNVRKIKETEAKSANLKRSLREHVPYDFHIYPVESASLNWVFGIGASIRVVSNWTEVREYPFLNKIMVLSDFQQVDDGRKASSYN